MYTKNLSVFGVGNNLDEALVVVDDAGLGIRRERELAYLDLVAGFFGFSLGKPDASDLRFAVGTAGNVILIDWLCWLAGDVSHGNDAAHGAGMRELRIAGHDVSDGINAFLACLHPLVYVHEATLGLHVRRLLQAYAIGVGPASYCD